MMKRYDESCNKKFGMQQQNQILRLMQSIPNNWVEALLGSVGSNQL